MNVNANFDYNLKTIYTICYRSFLFSFLLKLFLNYLINYIYAYICIYYYMKKNLFFVYLYTFKIVFTFLIPSVYVYRYCKQFYFEYIDERVPILEERVDFRCKK